MKTKKRIIVGVVAASLVIGLTAHMGHVFFGKETKVLADDVVGSDGIYKKISSSGTLGSSSNPFVILEIVPNELQAQVGYLVGGQEPVDLSEVLSDSSTTLSEKKNIASALSTWMTTKKTEMVFRDFRSAFSDSDWEDFTRIYMVEEAGVADRYATYDRVDAGGDYNVKVTMKCVPVELNEAGEIPESMYFRTLYAKPEELFVSTEILYGEYGRGKYTFDYESGRYKIAGKGGYLYDEDAKEYLYEDVYNERTGKTTKKKIPAGEYERLSDEGVLSSFKQAVGAEFVTYCDGAPYVNYDGFIEEENYSSLNRYVFEYVYTFEPAVGYSGEYKLNYKNLADSLEIAASDALRKDYTGSITFTEEYYDPSYMPYSIGAIPDSVKIYTGYRWGFESKELFKKYALGLIYKNETYSKGEDTSSYDFLGWYYEPECVNRFNESAAVKGSMTLYAKWAEVYTDSSRADNFSVNFDANVPEGEIADGFDFSTTIDRLSKGSKITEPNAAPHRAGYTFTGWYRNADCTGKVSFPMTIDGSTTLYAGWTPASGEYYIGFDANTYYTYDVQGIPDTKVVVRNNNRTEEDILAKPEDPTRNDGYVFGGWYWDSSCRNEYNFYDRIPEGYAYDNITLYARWIEEDNRPVYTISFNKNEPVSSRTVSAESVPSISVEYGSNAAASGFVYENYRLSLGDNISAKLDSFEVKVVTVTPADLAKSANQELIKRANLIVLSEPDMDGDSTSSVTNRRLAEIMKRYRNRNLFPDISSRNYNSSKYSFTSDSNDLSFTTVMNLFKKVTGENGKICPVVYDYEIYRNVTGNNKFSSNDNFESVLSNGDKISPKGNEKKGWSLNVYKLYLMTQQMNPVTLYNAYVKGDGPVDNAKINDDGSFSLNINGSTKSYKYWNEYTLIPWNAIDSSKWNRYTTDKNTECFDLLGLDFGVEIASTYNFSKIKNRLLIMNNKDNSFATAFAGATALPKADNADMFEFLGECASGDTYSLADGIYFMLNNTSVSENFSKDLQILEIEPSGVYKENGYAESFKDEGYWFWLVSRYVPNYSGKTGVTRMSTSSFIGDIQNLNSTYDIIYFGGNDSGINKAQMPQSDNKRLFAKNTEYVVGSTDNSPRAQDVSGFWRKETRSGAGSVSQSAKNGYSLVPSHVLLGSNYQGTFVLTNPQGADAQFTYSWVTDPNGRYQIYPNGDTNNGIRISDLTATFTNTDGSKVNFSLSNGGLYFDDSVWGWFGRVNESWGGSFQGGQIRIKDYYVKTATDEWVHYSGSAYVKAGDRIKLDSDQWLKIGEDSTYVYAHIGRIVDAMGNVSDDYKDSSGWMLAEKDGVNIAKAAYSGNDLTGVKYNQLMAFVDAGYPVIIGSELMEPGNINTSAVDSASYVYKFLQSVSKSEYAKLCFYEGQTDKAHDKDFVKALQNKRFTLDMKKTPVEYKDTSYKESGVDYTGLTDKDIYINGADINNKTIEYVFSIDSFDADDTYTLKLFFDTNADGRFTEETEKLDAIDVCEVKYNSSSDTYSKTANARWDSLKAGKTYKASCNGGEYIGLIPWKFEIVSNSNPLISDDTNGISAIKAVLKAHAYVLQILPNYGATIILPTNNEIEAADANGERLVGVYNGYGYVTSGDLYETANKFYKYTRDLEDFEVEYFRMTVDEFTRLVHDRNNRLEAGTLSVSDDYFVKTVNGFGYDPMTGTTGVLYAENVGFSEGILKCKNSEGQLAAIDMIIIGFADCFSDIESDEACDVINEFINSGKATLFTHDTTSYHNKPGAGWGYNINRYFRNILKQDRFDVTTYAGKEGTEAADRPYATGGKQEISNLAKTTVDGKSYVLNQGYTNAAMSMQVGQNLSTHVTKSNDGQITRYPYFIPDEMTVAQTHSQYYQIDFEDDDIVVWYSISDRNIDNYKTLNDVRNNYYIYNCGNITYTGVGHSAASLSDYEAKLFVNTMIAAYKAITTPAEMEITNSDKSTYSEDKEYLYVDYDETIDPEVSTPIGSEIITKGSDYFKRVYFTVNSYSIVLNKTLTVHFYPVVSDDDGTKVYREFPMDLQVYEYDPDDPKNEAKWKLLSNEAPFNYETQDGNGRDVIIPMKGPKVTSGNNYFVDVPLSDDYFETLFANGAVTGVTPKKPSDFPGGIYSEILPDNWNEFGLDSNSRFEVRLDILMRYGKKQSDNKPLSNSKGVVFTRRGMFDID